MTHPSPVPYSTTIRPEDTQRAMQTVTATLYPDETRPKAVDFAGTCPRCGHAIASREWLIAVKAAAKMTAEQYEQLIDALDSLDIDRSTGDVQFDLTCRCTESHKGRPADKQGCGASFRVRVTWP